MDDPRFTFVVTRTAARELRRCPKQGDILTWLERLCVDPFVRDNNVKPLTGMDAAYRRRFGVWRVSYTVDRAAKVIEVFEVRPRGGAYR